VIVICMLLQSILLCLTHNDYMVYSTDGIRMLSERVLQVAPSNTVLRPPYTRLLPSTAAASSTILGVITSVSYTDVT
jgi:hypothetical protein